MPLSFNNATGNLFNRLGKLAALIKNAKSYQTTQQTAMINTTTGVVAQYNGEPDIQALMGSAYIGQLNGFGGIGSLAQSIARSTINRMVFRDNPQLFQTLTTAQTLTSLQEVIRQMKTAGATVLAMTVAATATAFAGRGNAAVVVSVRRPLDGLVLENAFAETIKLVCTDDSYTGNATAGNETVRATGTGQQTDLFAFDWPLGSDGQTDLQAIDGNSDVSGGNLLTNSGFANFTSNVPDNWTLSVGTAGTHVFKETGLVYDSGAALRLAGDGSTLVALQQTFNSASGTLGVLEPAEQYPVNLFLRRDGTAAAAGVLTVELVDGSGVVIKDNNNADNSFTINLTTLTTDYTAYNGVFRTPTIMPSSYAIRYRMSTALSNGRSVYLDKAAVGEEMDQLYTGGPYLAVFAGSIPLLKDDLATVAITNSRGSGGTLDTWQTAMFRLFNNEIQGEELLLPSSATPTIADALIG